MDSDSVVLDNWLQIWVSLLFVSIGIEDSIAYRTTIDFIIFVPIRSDYNLTLADPVAPGKIAILGVCTDYKFALVKIDKPLIC